MRTRLRTNNRFFVFQFDAVNAKVRQPLAHIQHSCKGPERLISKRGDKLLDFESVAVKLEKVDGGGGGQNALVSPNQVRGILLIAVGDF